MNKLFIFIIVIALFFCVSCKKETELIVNDSYVEKVGYEYTNSLINGYYEKAYNNFPHDKKMKKILSPQIYKEFFSDLEKKSGSFIKLNGHEISKKGEYYVIAIGTIYEKNVFNINIVFNNSGEISGFNFSPYTFDTEKDDNNIIEKDIVFGTDDWKLEGKLTLPEGNGPFPCVILVHGSGPSDMNESIMSNHPFKDIAYALTKYNIAVFRYNKRTYTYREKIINDLFFTVNEETVDDVAEAFNKIKKENIIDRDNIYILGHSLGGNMIPKIAEITSEAAGYIITSANARPLNQLMEDQYNYLMGLSEELTDEERKYFDDAKSELKKLENLDVLNDNDFILGAYKTYWEDILNYKPLEKIRNIEKPVFILQGERDYQVTMEDYLLWKNTVSDKKNFIFKSYPGLNHLFIYGEEKSVPEEYLIKGKVSEELIKDIGTFINGRN